MKLLLFIALFFLVSCKTTEETVAGVDLCPTCIQFAEETLNELLNIILNVGVVGGCDELCELLGPKFGKYAVIACDLICDAAGIEGFIALLNKFGSDLDPIWFCQELKMCEVDDCKLAICANFTKPTGISPNPGVIGGTVKFSYSLETYQKTGTGELLLAIWQSPGSMPGILDFGEIAPKGYPKGTFGIELSCEFKDDTEGEIPIIFKPGMYVAHLHLCEGMCDTKMPHSRLLAEQFANFTMTN